SRTQGSKQIGAKLSMLKEKWPYTRALLQSFAVLWKRYREIEFHPLPLHYLQNQVQAIRGRFALGPRQQIPLEVCFLTVCRVCEHIYSIYNEYGETSYQASECFGYLGVRTDLQTGRMICRRDVAAHADFPCTELSELLILGQEVRFKKKRMIICPQPKCGMFCVLHDDPLHYNEYGFICSAHSALEKE